MMVVVPARVLRVLRAIDRLPMGLRIVVLLAAILHGCALSWGMPSSIAWDNDGIAPRDILPGLATTFTPGKYYTYPPLHLAILAVLTLPVTLVAVARADSTSIQAVIQEIIKPSYMTAITMTARIVTLLMSLGIVIVIALIAAEITSPATEPAPPQHEENRQKQKQRSVSISIFAALFATLNWAFSYYSHTSNLDVPYLFWAFLAVLALVRSVTRSTPRSLRTFAVFAVMAIATKDQAYAMFLLGAPVAIVVWAALAPFPRRNVRQVVREVAIALGIGVVLIAVLDGIVFNPSGFRARVAFLTGPASRDFEILSRDAHGRVLAFLDSFLYFRRHYPPALAVFVILGIGVTLVRAARAGRTTLAAALVPLFVALSFSICFNVAALRAEERFTLPQMLVGAIYAGSAFDLIWNGLSVRGTVARFVGRAICVVAFLRAGAECVRLNATLLAEPRYDAEAYLATHARIEDTIEVHGLNVYLPRFPPGPHVVRVGKDDPTRRSPIPNLHEVRASLGDIEERRPRFIVVSECYVWRYLERDDIRETTGHVVPSSQKVNAADLDATTFFRQLFRGELPSYRLVHEARIRSFERSWMHSSLGCPMFTFERIERFPE